MERIADYKPDVLLVEKSVARYAQELLLQKGISVVLNVKRSLLNRLARCTQAQVNATDIHSLCLHVVTTFCHIAACAERSRKQAGTHFASTLHLCCVAM